MEYRHLKRHLPAASLASVMCLIVGCGGSAKLDKDADLKAVTLSRGILQGTPATSLSATLYASDATLKVTPQADSRTATVVVDGHQVPSGQASPDVPMAVGANVIDVKVEAQEWDIVKSYPIAVTKNAPTTPVSVQDAVGGMAVTAATLDLTDATGKLLEGNIPVDATGFNTLGLPPGTYNVVASAPGYAQSALLGLDPAQDATAALYCHPLGMTNFPAVAPTIDRISYSADGITWKDVAGGAISDATANIQLLRVDASGRSGITASTWGGYGIGLGVDQMPVYSPNTGNYTTLPSLDNYIAKAVAGTDGNTWYQTETFFPVPVTSLAAGSSHFLDVVVYDVANNRAEQKVRLTLTDGAAVATDPDLSADAPAGVFVEADTYGTETQAFSLPAAGSPANSYEVGISFSMDKGIRGYEIYRSTDQTAWTKVTTSQFGYLDTTGSYYFVDQDPSLTTGVLYYYKVRAFNANTAAAGKGFSGYSSLGKAYLLPPWQMTLVSPANASVSTTLSPTFTFQGTDKALWDGNLVDRVYYYVHVQDKTGNDLLDQALRYNFLTAQVEVPGSTTWVSADSQQVGATAAATASGVTFTLDVPPGNMLKGDTVQWTVYGSYSNGSYGAPYFVKTFYNDAQTAIIGRAYSWGSDFSHKFDAVNGMFTLTFSPNAD